MGMNVAEKLIKSHLVKGEMKAGEEIAIRVDQTLTQDATGTMVMLELEALGVKKAKTEVSCQYVDHNQIQADNKNPDDHLFLESAAAKFGLWFSRPGNGISHMIHCEKFCVPGKSLLGSDSHTPASGSLGMLAIGAGGLEVALAIAGEPFYMKMPKVLGVRLEGTLPDFVSAKDVILELLRRRDVSGGVGMIIEYYGSGLDGLSAMDRHVIANMGAELGATTTVFPSDEKTREFFIQMGREGDWKELKADADASYQEEEVIVLNELEPLIAMPTSPGNVVKVSAIAGKPISQSYIGSSANPCPRDFAISAMMMKGRKPAPFVSFDVNPSSRQSLNFLVEEGYLELLIKAGARVHQAGCNGCIGMGQAPATNTISLRTTPRNFPGRSGTKEDQVYLCSPETATSSAITGVITDPRSLGMQYPKFVDKSHYSLVSELIPPKDGDGKVIKGPNIGEFPQFPELEDNITAKVILKLGDNVSTDEISPAGAEVLPYRSNIPKISTFTFSRVDKDFYDRASRHESSFIVAGSNYGQGSSREHAAISPRFLGVKAVICKSFARIHRKNLINFGVLPLTFNDPSDYEKIGRDDELELTNLHKGLEVHEPLLVRNKTKNREYKLDHFFSDRERRALLAGSLISLVRSMNKAHNQEK